MYVLKTLLDNRPRFILTLAGIALCTVLMLLLVAIYNGVLFGSVEYISSSNVDLWVLQNHSNNIMRSNSYLSIKHKNAIKKIEGAEMVAPVFFILVNTHLSESSPTIYLTGYDNKSGMGGPPLIKRGRNISSKKEIVIDQSFARKYHVKIGDRIPLKKDSLIVCGISEGTNMFVIQYAFVDLEEAWDLAGIDDYVSCYQVKLEPGTNKKEVANRIQAKLGNTIVFDQAKFLENNKREVESGILPLLFAVAFISAIVLTAILSLILTINVMEKREEYAIFKALGSPRGFVSVLVIKQSVILATSGLISGALLFVPFTHLVEWLSPEVSVRISLIHIAAVFSCIEILSLISAALPVLRLRTIYPYEVFR